MELVDIYIHYSKVEKDVIFNFIKNWLKDFKPESDIFEYPQYFGETQFETENFIEMILFILENPIRKYRFYFENEIENKRPKGMIFINKNSLYLGIGVVPNREKYFIDKLTEEYKKVPIVCYGGVIPDN